MEAVQEQSTTRAVPLVQGTAARRIVAVQGCTFTTAIAVSRAAGHQETGAELDAEGDRLRDLIADKLTVAIARSKREGAYETHALLVEIAAAVRRLSELDEAEDFHLIAAASDGVQQAIDANRGAIGLIEELLTGRPSCGATRPSMRVEETGRVIRFRACDQPPGHEAETCHYFEAAP